MTAHTGSTLKLSITIVFYRTPPEQLRLTAHSLASAINKLKHIHKDWNSIVYLVNNESGKTSPHEIQTATAVFWRDFIAEEDHLGRVGIHFNYLVIHVPQLAAQSDPAIDKFPNNGSLVSKETTNSHSG